MATVLIPVVRLFFSIDDMRQARHLIKSMQIKIECSLISSLFEKGWTDMFLSVCYSPSKVLKERRDRRPSLGSESQTCEAED